VVRTLVGEYTESASNHGRKVFKKVADGRAETVDVYMYYWDSRDGPSFEGWWFGNKLGGTQVWSHNASSGLSPPPSGWKIPWDGNVRPTLSVANKAEQAKTEAQSRLKNMGSEVNTASTAAKGALEQAKAAAGDYTSSEGLKEAEKLLQPQLTALAEAMKQLTDAQRAGSNAETQRQVQQMRSGLQALMSSINVELGKVRSSKMKAEQSEKQKALEERDMAVFQEVLPEAVSKANAAEDAVEKAVITSEMIAAGGDDLDEVRQAVGATEQAVQEAQKAMGEARIFLNAKQASARRYESDKVKAKAAQELGQLQAQLQEAQQKLNPLKNVRQEFVQRTAAQKIMQEVLEKLSPAEVDVDRAEEATEMLKHEGLSKELMVQAQQAVAKAGDHIGAVMRFIETKKKTAVGLAKEELSKMEERARQSVQRLADLKSSQKEASERVGLEVLVKEASEKLATVAETVSKAADAEGPFLMGVEELPLDETLAAVKAVETASTAANTAASIARMFIATKLVEAKRFTPELGKEAQTKLKAFQSDLETHTKRLNELKKSTAERKKAVTVREAEHEVKKAEDLAKEVAKAAEPLEDEKLAQLSSEEVRAASEATIKAEQAATKHLAETRKFITTRQIEAKGREASSEISSELIKYEARLRAVATEIGKYKKISASVESRLAAKKAIEDCSAKVKAVEQKFERLTELSEAIDGEKDKEEGKEPDISKDSKEKVQKALKEAEAAAAEMQAALKSAMRFTDMQIKIQPAASKEVEKLKPRLEELQQSLDKTVSGMRERSEKAIVDSIVKDSEHRVKEVEEAMKKLEEAEKPFKAEQEIPAEQVSESLSALEGAAQAATQALSGAKTFVGVKKLAARRLAEAPKKAAEEQLNVVVTRLDELTKTLSESKKAMNEQKQDLVKKEVEGKVIEAEKKVQLAEEATAELAKLIQSEAEEEKPEGAAELPADQVKSNCEKVGSAQQEARTSVTSAQKLLLSRQRDAKNGSGPPNLLEDINKQLENLTKMLTSLDKQKSTLRDQEHKYVAQKLQKDVMTLAATEEAKLAKLYPVAEELVASLGGDQANPLAAMESCQKDLTTAQESLADTMSKIKEKMEGIKGQTLPKGGYLAEARNGLVKLKVKVGAMENKCKKLVLSLKSAREGMTAQAEEALLTAVQVYARQQGLTADALFKQLSNGEPEVKQANLRAFVEKIPDSPVKASQLDLALDKFASGMSKLNVLEMVQEFKRCVKEVALTNTLEVKDGKTVRKLGLGEVLEVLETGRKDEVTGLSRLRCRALVDLKEGWVTVEGNAGSSFLEPCRKPYFCCEHESVLQQTFESNSATLKTLQVGEVLELAEGPRKENPPGVMRVKAKTLKDGKVGFLTCKDVAKEYWRPAKVMVCKQSIALTTGFDIAAGKAVRKLEVGEALDILEGPSEDAVRSLSRAKVLAKKDGQEGWLTIKGNQGTSYAEESERHYICSESIVLEAKFATGSTEVRRVEEGELLEALEEPKPETKEGVQRCRGRTLADGTEGWFTLTKSFVPWSPAYKCVSSTVLNNGLEIKEAKTLRKLEPGEMLEAIDTPILEPSAGLLRLKLRTQDHLVGFATVRGNKGTELLKTLAGEAPEKPSEKKAAKKES